MRTSAGALWFGNGWGLVFTSGNNLLYILCLSDTQFRLFKYFCGFIVM